MPHQPGPKDRPRVGCSSVPGILIVICLSRGRNTWPDICVNTPVSGRSPVLIAQRASRAWTIFASTNRLSMPTKRCPCMVTRMTTKTYISPKLPTIPPQVPTVELLCSLCLSLRLTPHLLIPATKTVDHTNICNTTKVSRSLHISSSRREDQGRCLFCILSSTRAIPPPIQ